MSSRAALEGLLKAEIASGFFTSSFVASGRLDEGQPIFQASYAQAQRDQRVIFDLASLTKALVTGPLIWEFLYKEGLSLDAPLACLLGRDSTDWHPNFLDLPICELIGHYSGLPAWWNFWMNRLGKPSLRLSPVEREKIIAEVFFRIPPFEGKKDLYSDLGYILLGAGLEKFKVTDLGSQFERWKEQLGFPKNEPLAYLPNLSHDRSSFIPSAFCAVRERLLIAEVHDENCAALGEVAGHAGLFGSGQALALYLHRLWCHSLGRDYLEANERQRLNTQHEGLFGLRRGGEKGSASLFGWGQAMGHLGFTGTAFWLHFPSRRYGIFLSNRVISGRVSSRMTDLRREVFGLLHEISD